MIILIFPLAGSYECRCAKDCKSLNVNYIKSPIVRTIPPSIYKKKKVNGTLILESAGVPIAKQGGSSCYPSACMNGGTCFSQYNPAVQTTTTTTASPMGQAICVSILLFLWDNFKIFETVLLLCSSHVNHNFQARDVKFIVLNQFKIGIICVVFTTKEICIFVKMVVNVCLFQTERVKGKRLLKISNCFIR